MAFVGEDDIGINEEMIVLQFVKLHPAMVGLDSGDIDLIPLDKLFPGHYHPCRDTEMLIQGVSELPYEIPPMDQEQAGFTLAHRQIDYLPVDQALAAAGRQDDQWALMAGND